jgi:mannose-6-phosphate isomerase-like protein (cupin superfamily)
VDRSEEEAATVTGHYVSKASGQICDLGVITMRVLVEDEAGGAFALVEFRGGEGPWTIPHVHEHTSESFFVQQGVFDFECGGERVTAQTGDYFLVPVGNPHMITAAPGGGTLLSIMAPAGLQEMFMALSRLPAGSLRDPVARREIAKDYDSVPV